VTVLEKLLIIDGLNVVRRIYEANPAPDSPSKVTGAVKAALHSFKRALTEHQPTHVVSFFDAGGPTWRHEIYPEYRKSRKPMPQLLRDALPELYSRLLAEVRVPCRSYAGIEADDAVAQTALCCRQEFPGAEIVVLSTDKDLTRLIASGIKVYDHFEGTWRDEAWVHRKFGVPSAQLADLLALTGDASDDIPGVTKVGPKSAAALLTTYGSLEEVLAHASDVKGKLGERLQSPAERESALISQRLVAFKLDSNLFLNWDELALTAVP
jgi:protein Xni